MIEDGEFQVIWEHDVKEALKRRINLVHFFLLFLDIAKHISLSNEFRSQFAVNIGYLPQRIRMNDVFP